MLISSAVTVQLICAFVFAYAKCRFSHDIAQIIKEISSYMKQMVCNDGNHWNISVLNFFDQNPLKGEGTMHVL